MSVPVRSRFRMPLACTATVVSLTLAVGACAGGAHSSPQSAPAAAPPAPAPADPASAKAQGTGSLHRSSSLAIYPTSLAGQPSPKVAEVVGMMLERGGMTELELVEARFEPAKEADWAGTMAGFGAFVRTHPPAGQYAMYSQFLGVPGQGVSEVRSVIVDRDGAVVWQERLTGADAAFAKARPREPMDCCVLTVNRLRPVLGLEDPFRAGAPEGAIARRWEKATGVPDAAAQAAMKARREAFARGAGSATVVVYAPKAAPGVPTSAAALAEGLNRAGVIRALPVEETPALEIRGDMNEQKILWSMANSFAGFVTRHPPQADYALFPQYLMGVKPDGSVTVVGVHLALCNRAGELVAVDFQNDHQPDFQAVNPHSVDACNELAVRRMKVLAAP